MGSTEKRWSQWASPKYCELIRQAEDLLSIDDVEGVKRLLVPLAALSEPAALTILSRISHESEPWESFVLRQRAQIEVAAELGFPPAIYLLGLFYDEGENGYPIDRVRAASLFREAAEKGHVQSQWIYALDLLNGRNGIALDESLGHSYLLRAYDAGLQRALESVADFYRRGVFGFEKSESLASAIYAKSEAAENWI